MGIKKPTVPHGTTCGAKTRKGAPCSRVAGFGTDHLGQGRCRWHGGATPIKHGRYSSVTRPRLAELLARAATDNTDPLDLEPELQLLRALVLDYIERYDETTEALLNWHSSFGDGFAQAVQDWRHKLADWCELEDQSGVEPPRPPIPIHFEGKPRQVPDILSVGRFISEIGAMVERQHKRRTEGSITLATLDRVLEQHGLELQAAVQDVITDASTREILFDAIETRWNGIRLDTIKPSGSRITGSTGPPN